MAQPHPTPLPSKPKLNVPIKLWVSQEMYDQLVVEAKARDWSVPHLIRHLIHEGRRDP
jgi:hypothetical protein